MSSVKELDKQQQDEESDKLASVASARSIIKPIDHSPDFWSNINNHCNKKAGPFGTDSIKKMIKSGKMTVHDTNPYRINRTLLHTAAVYGAYELVQFLITHVCSVIFVFMCILYQGKGACMLLFDQFNQKHTSTCTCSVI